MTEQSLPPKKKFSSLFKESDIPLIVYFVVFATMAVVWSLNTLMPDLALNLFSELVGAAFTLFIIDVLLVRSKSKRWKAVSEHIDYLIARDINRIRDGVAARAFNFNPQLDGGQPEHVQLAVLRQQRAALLTELETLSLPDLLQRVHHGGLFNPASYEYFSDKANDIWNLLNMKYSEYLSPELVACLIELHTNLKDVGSHIRQYAKAERHAEDQEYYHAVGIKGASISLRECVRLLNQLKQQGYSAAASISDEAR